MNAKQKQIKDAFFLAERLALEEVERMARSILARHENLDEFVMCMGSWFFTVREGSKMETGYILTSDWNVDETDFKYLKPFANFMGEWDEYLKLTGNPMRFTATGKKITRW